MISLYGSSGFIGSNFKNLYPDCIEIPRNQRKPETKNILYFISTVDNYNVHNQITIDVDTNLRVLCEVLDHCRSKDIVFNFISSWFVYGKSSNLPVKENASCNPTGFYSITKLCAEQLIQSFASTYGMKYRILRLCNVLGKGDKGASKKKNAITWMINELKLNNDISLYNNGSHIRDIMHVEDVCEAIKIVIDKGELNQTYNIGSGKPTTIKEIIYSARDCINSKSKIKNVNPPDFHKTVQTENFWMDTTKLQSLGFEPKKSLEFIIKDLCL